jgi:hypothetical protein
VILRHIDEHLNLHCSSFALEVVGAFNRLTCALHRFCPEVMLFTGELRVDCMAYNIPVSGGSLQLFNTKDMPCNKRPTH